MAFDPDGQLRDEIHFGDRVLTSSVAFAGPGLDRMIVTIGKGGTVAALPARHPGLPPLTPSAV
jgi:gluconolactonase